MVLSDYYVNVLGAYSKAKAHAEDRCGEATQERRHNSTAAEKGATKRLRSGGIILKRPRKSRPNVVDEFLSDERERKKGVKWQVASEKETESIDDRKSNCLARSQPSRATTSEK